MKKIILLLFVFATTVISQSAIAEVCDYRPSKVVGAGVTAVIGAGMKAAGVYVFPHAAGATMLGSTAAGASAAGTIGIIAGTGGVVGTTGAFIISPIVIGTAAIAAVGVAAWEGGCYLADE